MTKKAVEGTAEFTKGAVEAIGTPRLGERIQEGRERRERRKSKDKFNFDQQEDYSNYIDDEGYQDYYE